MKIIMKKSKISKLMKVTVKKMLKINKKNKKISIIMKKNKIIIIMKESKIMKIWMVKISKVFTMKMRRTF